MDRRVYDLPPAPSGSCSSGSHASSAPGLPYHGVPRSRVTEVAPALDIAALLVRMQKAHRLQRSRGDAGDGDDADGAGV